jgi:hypothetical protein
VAVGRPTGPVVALRSALPLLALALGLLVVAPGRSAAQGTPPPTPAPVPLAEAYTAAWNAHDLPAVLALFAPDAIVRERRGEVPPAVWDTRDPRVVRAYLDGSHSEYNYDTHGLTWVTGRPQIEAWAAARFARHHRIAVGQHRAAGDTVGWSYREFVDPFQLVPGLSPTEGDAEAAVRGGRITVLTLVVSPESARRQWGEADGAFVRAMATHRASPLGEGPSVRPSGSPRGGAAAEPTGAAWPLALSGLALLAGGTVALRRRRRP